MGFQILVLAIKTGVIAYWGSFFGRASYDTCLEIGKRIKNKIQPENGDD